MRTIIPLSCQPLTLPSLSTAHSPAKENSAANVFESKGIERTCRCVLLFSNHQMTYSIRFTHTTLEPSIWIVEENVRSMPVERDPG